MTFVVTRDAQGAVTISGSASSEGLSISMSQVVASFHDEYKPAETAENPAEPETPAAEPATPEAAASPAAATDPAGDADPSPASPAPFKCPECGAGFDGPGVCENQHPAATVVPIAQAAAGASDEAASPEAETPAEPVWPDAGSAGSQ